MAAFITVPRLTAKISSSGHVLFFPKSKILSGSILYCRCSANCRSGACAHSGIGLLGNPQSSSSSSPSLLWQVLGGQSVILTRESLQRLHFFKGRLLSSRLLHPLNTPHHWPLFRGTPVRRDLVADLVLCRFCAPPQRSPRDAAGGTVGPRIDIRRGHQLLDVALLLGLAGEWTHEKGRVHKELQVRPHAFLCLGLFQGPRQMQMRW